MKSRAALVNEMRGLLTEYRIVFPQGRRVFAARFLGEFSKHGERLSGLGQETFYDLYSEYCEVDQRMKRYEMKLKEVARQSLDCMRLIAKGFLLQPR